MTRFRSFLTVILLASLLGCQGLEEIKEAAPEPTQVLPPASLQATTIGIYNGDQAVHVGQTWQEALRAFPEPNGAFRLTDTPVGFQQNYQGMVWEAGREGFGSLLFDNRIAAAFYQVEVTDGQKQMDIVTTHLNALGEVTPITVSADRVNYWFWEDEGQRLMICAVRTDSNHILLTVAAGVNLVMDALRASPSSAQTDSSRAEQMFSLKSAQED